MRAGLVALTGFGDTAVLMPLAAVMLLWLLVMRSPRGAVWWAITVAFCVGMTALLKVSFCGCPPTPDLHSPSGHTSLSTLVYGAMTLVTANETGGVRRIMAVSGGTGFILAIAASRLLLHAHSTAEVGVGLVIGTAALALFGLQYPRYRAKEMWLFPLFVACAALVTVLHGRELRAEEFLREMAGYLRIHCG
jgi:membrane-associated phospholipid phosphatase